MCNPLLMIGAQAVGGVNQAVGAYYSAGAQRDGMRSQARFAEINARMADLAQASAWRSGERAQQSHRMQVTATKERARVATAANGVDMTSASAIRGQATTDLVGELDAQAIEANAAAVAMGHRAEAGNMRSQAASLRGAAGAINPGLSALQTLVTSGTKVAGSWYGMQKAEPAPESDDPLFDFGRSKGLW